MKNKYLFSLIVLYLALFTSTAFASIDIQMWPIKSTIGETSSSQLLWFKNLAKTPADVEIRVFNWQQIKGKDKLTPQKTVVVSPPLLGILPGATQSVRLILQGEHPTQEQAYQIVVDEIPNSTGILKLNKSQSGFDFRMRYILPLFITGTQTPSVNLKNSNDVKKLIKNITWNIVNKNGKSYLMVKNNNLIHIKMLDISLLDIKDNKSIKLNSNLMSYVLSHGDKVAVLPQVIKTHPSDFKLEFKLSKSGQTVSLAYHS